MSYRAAATVEQEGSFPDSLDFTLASPPSPFPDLFHSALISGKTKAMALWYDNGAQPSGLARILHLGQGKRYSALCVLAVAKQSTFFLQVSIGHLRRV